MCYSNQYKPTRQIETCDCEECICDREDVIMHKAFSLKRNTTCGHLHDDRDKNYVFYYKIKENYPHMNSNKINHRL